MSVVWMLVIWFSLPLPDGIEGEIHLFQSPEACEVWKANYMKKNDEFNGNYVISRCKPKQLEE